MGIYGCVFIYFLNKKYSDTFIILNENGNYVVGGEVGKVVDKTF